MPGQCRQLFGSHFRNERDIDLLQRRNAKHLPPLEERKASRQELHIDQVLGLVDAVLFGANQVKRALRQLLPIEIQLAGLGKPFQHGRPRLVAELETYRFCWFRANRLRSCWLGGVGWGVDGRCI